MPIEQFAHKPVSGNAASGFRLPASAGSAASGSAAPAGSNHAAAELKDDAGEFIRTLKLPFEVARFEYPRRCRIRRVRVLAPPDDTISPAPGPVIVSRQALGELRNTR